MFSAVGKVRQALKLLLQVPLPQLKSFASLARLKPTFSVAGSPATRRSLGPSATVAWLAAKRDEGGLA